jgi:hypothetical protein
MHDALDVRQLFPFGVVFQTPSHSKDIRDEALMVSNKPVQSLEDQKAHRDNVCKNDRRFVGYIVYQCLAIRVRQS